jgi:hypothetical protein
MARPARVAFLKAQDRRLAGRQPILSVLENKPRSGMGCTMSTLIREQDGFITIYDHNSRKLMMIELHGLQKKISREMRLGPTQQVRKKRFMLASLRGTNQGLNSCLYFKNHRG